MLERMSTSGDEPVTLAQAKLAARIDGADLDDQLTRAIRTARAAAEHITGRSYVLSVWRESRSCWPCLDDAIDVEGATACAVSYWNGTAWATLGTNEYAFAPGACGGTVLAPAVGKTWPTLGAVAVGPRVRIDLTAGDPAIRPVPDCVKDFICANVATWVKNPEALASNTLSTHALYDRLLDTEMTY